MTRLYKNLADRILSNTVKQGECWCWALALSDDGYGRISLRVGLSKPRGFWVHRVAYELFVGPIPAGMTVDHRIEEGLCRYKHCWRPEHLRLLTVGENTSVANITKGQRRRLIRQLSHPQRCLL